MDKGNVPKRFYEERCRPSCIVPSIHKFFHEVGVKERKMEPSEYLHGVIPQYWVEPSQIVHVTCMVLKATVNKVNDRRTSISLPELHGPRSDIVRQVVLVTTTTA
ncbi:hypothetical protein TNCV_445701 [Trichonephila clavipes]|nr:hypothetical protein TNCV_445701 [Trichonephila clavipes]